MAMRLGQEDLKVGMSVSFSRTVIFKHSLYVSGGLCEPVLVPSSIKCDV